MSTSTGVMRPTCGQAESGGRSTAGKIARSTGVIALATAFSRVLGVVRDLLFARLFGTTAASEAFVVAFRLPNMLRDLVAEGAVTSAIVPVLSRARAKGDADAFWQAAQALLSRLSVGLVLLGLGGAVLAPQIVHVTAPGFASDPEKLRLTILLTRILFPFITLVGLWAFFMGVLNSLGHFAVPSLGPAVLNLAMIASLLWCVPMSENGIVTQAWAVMIGGVIQLAMQVPTALKRGFRFRWRWRHPATHEMLRLLGPRILGSAVYQLDVLIDTAFASMSAIVGSGAVAALYYASRLAQLPLALFGTASAQASLPSLSEQAAHEDWESFRNTLLAVIRMIGFVMLPSAVGLIVLSEPVTVALFERGVFDHHSSLMTMQALAWYAVGLWGYAASKVLTGAFYAAHDTRTPVILAAEAVALNVVLSLLLMGPMKVGGLALAASAANLVNAHQLLRRMELRLKAPLLKPLCASLARTAGASALMGLASYGAWRLSGLGAHSFVGLGLGILVGMVSYAAAAWALRIPEFATMRRWIFRMNPTR